MAFSLGLSVIYMARTVVAGAHMIKLNVSGLRNHSEARKLNAAESVGEPGRERGREGIPPSLSTISQTDPSNRHALNRLGAAQLKTKTSELKLKCVSRNNLHFKASQQNYLLKQRKQHDQRK